MSFYDAFSVPEWALCAIEYGDYSGLSDEEIAQVEQFSKEWPTDRYYIEWGYDRYFSNNPAFGLPCECLDAGIYEREEVQL